MFPLRAQIVWLAFITGAVAWLPEAVSEGPIEYVNVAGQVELVPKEWIATPAGKLAHSITLPSAVPKPVPFDFTKARLVAMLPGKPSVSAQYFEHLCKTEAGEFIFRTAENVDGLYFMRPPARPTDHDLKDRLILEAPEIERTFQLLPATTQERGQIFINPPWSLYSYVEEPSQLGAPSAPYLRARGYKQNVAPMIVEETTNLASHYGLVWRGIKRPNDRDLGIAGSEWIVIDLQAGDVLAVQRNFGRTGFDRNIPSGIWWLNALACENLNPRDNFTERFYKFASRVLRPMSANSSIQSGPAQAPAADFRR